VFEVTDFESRKKARPEEVQKSLERSEVHITMFSPFLIANLGKNGLRLGSVMSKPKCVVRSGEWRLSRPLSTAALTASKENEIKQLIGSIKDPVSGKTIANLGIVQVKWCVACLYILFQMREVRFLSFSGFDTVCCFACSLSPDLRRDCKLTTTVLQK
jgi:hypothetical protein